MTRVLTDVDTDEVELDQEQLRVITWRIGWLRDAGYSVPNCRRIAYRDDINYKFACQLLRQCKDEELAMEILL